MNQSLISRAHFLKATSAFAAGLSLVPSIAAAEIFDASTVTLASYQIVLPDQPTEIERQAGDILRKHLRMLAGTDINLVSEGQTARNNAIYVGRTRFSEDRNISVANSDTDGYARIPAGNNLIIVGGAKKGLLFGVYDLLDSLGFRKYAPDSLHVPQDPSFLLPRQEVRFSPYMRYRTTSYGFNPEYSDWHKLSSRGEWGLFVHTFHTLLPAKDYAEKHPEWYSLINGKRSPGTQLCLSNEEMTNELIVQLKKRIADRPTATYWSVSQDDNDQYCRCEACTSLNKKYGDVPSGSIIYFVNKVAKAIPDKTISTLAYWYSRKAPQGISVEPNVNIMLCNIESRRHAPVYVTDPEFSKDLKDWGALSKDILIWDYNIQFTNFFGPFPNLHTIKPNIKYYKDNNVNALFMQSNNEPAAEMALLRGYLINRLMWTPEADEKAIINEFLTGYYGAAGPFIQSYIDAMRESLERSDMKLNIFGDPIDARETYLSADMMSRYKELFNLAEAAVKSDAELLRRVLVARLPIKYAEIQIGRTEVDTPRSMYYTAAGGQILPRESMKALVYDFVSGLNHENVRLVRERAGSPDHFKASFDRVFANMEAAAGTKSIGKAITAITRPAEKSKPIEALTDGLFGSFEAWQSADQNWVYFTGEHMDFILDLGKITDVNTVNMDFLNPQAQPDWHLYSLPGFVSYSLSSDGNNYSAPTRIDNPHDPDPAENPGIVKISVFPFTAKFTPGTQARYIRVHAESLLKMPEWHIRRGQPASIYTDQIVVT